VTQNMVALDSQTTARQLSHRARIPTAQEGWGQLGATALAVSQEQHEQVMLHFWGGTK